MLRTTGLPWDGDVFAGFGAGVLQHQGEVLGRKRPNAWSCKEAGEVLWGSREEAGWRGAVHFLGLSAFVSSSGG